MISVIIPCYNCEATINRAVDSVFSQSHQNWELILVDNNSSDNTLDLLQNIRDNNRKKSIKVLQQVKKGANAARNLGLSNAVGRYVQFLDADDELYSDKLLHNYEQLSESKNDFIAGRAMIEEIKSGKKIQKERKLYEEDAWIALGTSRLGITSANFWSMKCLTFINGFDEELTSSQEYDLMFRLLKNGFKCSFSSYLGVIIHKSPNSISKSTDPEKFINILNKRIELRNSVKKYLVSQDALTQKRRYEIDKYIYFEVEGNKHLDETWGNSNLKELNFSLSNKDLIIHRIKRTIKIITAG